MALLELGIGLAQLAQRPARQDHAHHAPAIVAQYAPAVQWVAAMVAQARGLVEFWFAWLLVDIVGVPLAFSSGLAFSGLVYVIYLALVLWGMRDWWQRSRATAAALEGAPA